MEYETYTGVDVCKWFLERLSNVTSRLVTIIDDKQRIQMTQSDWAEFSEATSCWICRWPFDPQYPEFKVRDHDHLTGKYRGAAHSICNLHLKQYKKIPVFLHNFRGYDGHLIALATEHFSQTKLKIIGQSYEKYPFQGFGPYIIFKDSYQFMSYSLEQLGRELLNSGVEKFPHLRKQFPDIPDEKFRLLLRKGVYPYENMDRWEKLKQATLPSKDDFYNSLRAEACSDDDYSHAQLVWKEFNCHSMQEYQNLYLKTDVLILADIFHNFRKL